MLISTPKFSVWGSSNERTADIRVIASNGNLSVGGRKVVLDDMFKVSVQNYTVGIDPKTSSDMTAKESKLNDTIISSFRYERNESGTYFPEELCRAVLFYKIVSLLQCNSNCRLDLVHFLVNLLNSKIVPCFSSLERVGIELIALCYGEKVNCYTSSGIKVAKEALKASNIDIFHLSKCEYDTLLVIEYAIIGMTCLLAGSIQNTFKMLDVIAAYSFECSGLNTFPFDPIHFDICRQQRGLMTSSSNLRLLLEGTRANATFDSSSYSNLLPFTDIPQIHGPATDSCSQLTR